MLRAGRYLSHKPSSSRWFPSGKTLDSCQYTLVLQELSVHPVSFCDRCHPAKEGTCPLRSGTPGPWRWLVLGNDGDTNRPMCDTHPHGQRGVWGNQPRGSCGRVPFLTGGTRGRRATPASLLSRVMTDGCSHLATRKSQPGAKASVSMSTAARTEGVVSYRSCISLDCEVHFPHI